MTIPAEQAISRNSSISVGLLIVIVIAAVSLLGGVWQLKGQVETSMAVFEIRLDTLIDNQRELKVAVEGLKKNSLSEREVRAIFKEEIRKYEEENP